MILVFDLEANGLYDDKTNKDGTVSKATEIHCIVVRDISSDDFNITYEFTSAANNIEQGSKLLEEADLLICHNQIDYDLRLIKKLYPDFKPTGQIIDTLILSQLLYSDLNGGHSLEAYGETMGIAKIKNEDWSVFTPLMLDRCKTDVEINHRVYVQLMEDSYGPVKGIPYSEIFTTECY